MLRTGRDTHLLTDPRFMRPLLGAPSPGGAGADATPVTFAVTTTSVVNVHTDPACTFAAHAADRSSDVTRMPANTHVAGCLLCDTGMVVALLGSVRDELDALRVDVDQRARDAEDAYDLFRLRCAIDRTWAATGDYGPDDILTELGRQLPPGEDTRIGASTRGAYLAALADLLHEWAADRLRSIPQLTAPRPDSSPGP